MTSKIINNTSTTNNFNETLDQITGNLTQDKRKNMLNNYGFKNMMLGNLKGASLMMNHNNQPHTTSNKLLGTPIDICSTPKIIDTAKIH